MGKKSTVATVEQRVTEIYKLLLRGASRRAILRYGTENGWGVNDRQIENYMARATVAIAEETAAIRTNALEKAIAGRNELLLDAWKSKQYHTALAAMDGRDKLLGLYEKAESVTDESTIVVLPEKDARNSDQTPE